MKKSILMQLAILGVFIFVAAGSISGQEVNPTKWFGWFYDDASTYNGELLTPGMIITAYDLDGVLCGIDTVEVTGNYGFMPVYGDDPGTPVDEGAAQDGELISFRINGRAATVVSGDPTYADQIGKQVRLSADAVIGITAVDLPTFKLGTFNDTVRFEVGVRNDGDGQDFYGVTAVNGNANFHTLPQTASFYADPGETVYVYFDIETPLWTPDTVNHITFSVYSMLDPTVEVTGEVDLYFTITNVGDDPGAALPSGFALHQNYPNPFNPATTIAFTLPARSRVGLDVFDVLGCLVESRDLGDLPAGEHSVSFDGSSLGSGVYFYRLSSEGVSLTRKMVLLK